MDPEGITDSLLSSRPEEIALEFSKSQDRSNMETARSFEHNTSTSTIISSEIDERRCRSQPRMMPPPLSLPPPSIVTTTWTGRCDSSTIGSDDVLYYCCDNEQASEKTVCSSSRTIDGVFRESQWYQDSNTNIIIFPSVNNCNTSSSHDLTMNTSYDDETTLYLLEDSLESYSHDDDDDDIEMFQKVDYDGIVQNEEKAEEVLEIAHQGQLEPSAKMQSFIVGLLLGLFMQFSTLGANFLVSSYYLNKENNGGDIYSSDSPFNLVTFNITWSIFASLLGVFFMIVTHYLLSLLHKPMKSKLIYMECFITTGALVGVCLAWIGTDELLHVHGHFVLSLTTLAGALIWCKILTVLLQSDNRCASDGDRNGDDEDDDHEDQISLNEPLLPKQGNGSARINGSSVKLQRKIKIAGSVLGALTGIFIQFSSLAVNFLLQAIYGSDVENESSEISQTSQLGASLGFNDSMKEKIISISFLWSFITSLIGIFLLLTIRFMVSDAILSVDMKNRSDSFLIRHHDKLILHLECAFALGAIVGLNAAWTFTDSLLGLESHFIESAFTLIGTFAWCKVVLYCCGERALTTSKDDFRRTELGNSENIV